MFVCANVHSFFSIINVCHIYMWVVILLRSQAVNSLAVESVAENNIVEI